jgi:signal transduction histidine kinase
MSQRSSPVVDRRLAAGLALLCLLVVSSALNFLTTEQQHDSAEWLAHSHEVVTTLEAFRSDVSASGAALRGHVLSGQPADLATYRERADQARRNLARLESLTRDNQGQQARLPVLRERLGRLEALRDDSLRTLGQSGLEASVALFLREGGPALLAELERQVDAIASHERDLLDERHLQAERAYRISLWTGLGSGLLSVLSIAFYLVALQRHARATAQSSQRMAELTRTLQESDRKKDAFIATLAHELRNPLAPIGSASEILLRPGTDASKVRWAAEMIRRQVGHMRILLDDLLDVARITQGKLHLQPRPVALDEVVDAALEVSTLAIEARHHRLSVQRPAAGTQVVCDPVRLAQVITNLLNNAARYTEPGGDIVLAAWTEGTDLRLQVRDTGIGLSAAAQQRIFEPFEQVAPRSPQSQGGLGIGLALTRGLVELHGGRISAHSDGPQLGTVFSVLLPAAVVPETAAPERAADVHRT